MMGPSLEMAEKGRGQGRFFRRSGPRQSNSLAGQRLTRVPGDVWGTAECGRARVGLCAWCPRVAGVTRVHAQLGEPVTLVHGKCRNLAKNRGWTGQSWPRRGPG